MITRDVPARSMEIRASTLNRANRSVEAVIATDRAVAVCDYRGGIIDEVLRMDGARLPQQMPLLSDHSRTLGDVLGHVADMRLEGNTLTGRLYFADTPDVENVWRKVAGGHLTAVSVGYRVDRADELRAGETKVVNGRSYTAGVRTLRVATAWTPKECSLVSIGADDQAHVRSSKEKTMIRTISEPADKLQSALSPMFRRAGVRWTDAARAAVEFMGHQVPEDERVLLRTAMSTAAIAETFDAEFGSALLRGFSEEPDTTTGWTREVNVPNFNTVRAFAMDRGTRLVKLGRGDEAESAEFSLSAESWKISRFARQFVVDEQYMSDGQPVNAILAVVEQLGAAARRVRPDLVYAMLLSNPTLATDSTALFHTDHGNVGSGAGSAMGTAGLGTGMAAIGNQTYEDVDSNPVHVNNRAAVVVVPPDLVEVTRRTVRNLVLSDGADLEVRAESRLSATGVVDPDTDALIAGSATNWLLAARAAVIPSIVVGGLNGVFTPKIRRYVLDQGEWGIGWDILLDIGAAAVDHRGVYFSAGA